MSAIAKRHNIPLIEDCSQAHWTHYKDRLVGTIGDIGCFSFQQSKHMTTGDGGMTITSNQAYYERMKLFADKGYARKGWGARSYLFHAPNYRMTELVGAVGLAQLGKVKAVVEKRRELGEHLTSLLRRIDGVEPVPVTEGARPSYWQYPLYVNGVSAEAFATEMIRQKIWVLAGYTGKPIYLCSESLAAKQTYGQSQWPFNCNPGITYEYRGRAVPARRSQPDAGGNYSDRRKPRPGLLGTDRGGGLEHDEDPGFWNRPRPRRRASPSRRARRRRRPASRQSPKVRVAIVGCGQMGRWHFDSYKANPRVEVVASWTHPSIVPSVSRAKPTGGRTVLTRSSSRRNLWTPSAFCTVPSTHRDIAIDLLNAGINVLCEKPLAIRWRRPRKCPEGRKNKIACCLRRSSSGYMTKYERPRN